MFGLDISDRILRLVSLKKRGKKIYIKAASEIKIPVGLIAEGEILKIEQVVPLLINLVKKVDRRKIGREVIACLPERKSFIKVIEVPKSEDSTLDQAIKSELTNHVPFSLEEIYFDWQLLDKQENNNSKKLRILIGGVPKRIVETYQEVLKKSKLIPVVLEIESIAISRAILPLNQTFKKEAVLIIDLGLDRTSFIIYDHGTIQFTTGLNNFSGNLLTNLLAEKFSLSYTNAEKAKRLAGFDAAIGKGLVTAILKTVIQDLKNEIEKLIDFYQLHYPLGHPLNRIILTGGGANLKAINQTLEKIIKIKTETGNSLINLEKKGLPSTLVNNQFSYNTAVGLALRGIYYDHFKPHLS